MVKLRRICTNQMPANMRRNAILFLVILLLIVEVCVFNKKFINSVLDKAYNTRQQNDSSKEDIFISKMWPNVSETIPVSVKIPSFRKKMGTNDWPLQSLHLQHSTYHGPFFLCTMETSIEPKVGDILNTNFEKSEDYTNCVVEAKLDFTNSVNFDIYVEDSYEQKSEPVSVSYSFKGENTVKFWLKIPNFSKEQEKISPDCIIYIDSFSVEKLSEPTVDESKFLHVEARKMEKQFWNSVKTVDIYNMMSLGIMEALSSKLHADTSRTLENTQKTSWVCLSNHFEHNANDKKVSKTHQREKKTERNNSQIMESLQIGIEQSVSSFSSQPQRHVLMMDFTVAEQKSFTSKMPGITGDNFTLITYAPVAFRHLRNFFGLKEEKFVAKFCRAPLTELLNPGRSGSSFYLSENKHFIAKTVQSKEVDLLLRLLPAYVLNLYQNPATLLPKIYGLYWYKQSVETSLRLLVMNNVMPSNMLINVKYDLKGSTVHRKLSTKELKEHQPPLTYKDIDFKNHHPQGIYLRADDHKKLMESIQSDSLMLQSFQIMDYSLLLGVHYEDEPEQKSDVSSTGKKHIPCEKQDDAKTWNNRFNVETNNNQKSFAWSGIPAWTAHGEKLTVFVGIIDILQTYDLKRKSKQLLKSITYDLDEVSVHNPAFYAHRFENFMGKRVFKMLPPCPAG